MAAQPTFRAVADDKTPGGDVGDQYEIPAPEPFISFNALKDRIRYHYDAASDYYYSLW
jgi:tocopherol O-methyltransferase